MWGFGKTISKDGIRVTLGEKGQLKYREGSETYIVSALDGDGYGIVIEEMADGDLSLMSQSIERRVEIAKKIRQVLKGQGIRVDLYQDHRVVEA
jgi:hypothetical protein